MRAYFMSSGENVRLWLFQYACACTRKYIYGHISIHIEFTMYLPDYRPFLFGWLLCTPIFYQFYIPKVFLYNDVYHLFTVIALRMYPWQAELSSYPGFFREPHWLSIGLPEISRVIRQLCISNKWLKKIQNFAHDNTSVVTSAKCCNHSFVKISMRAKRSVHQFQIVSEKSLV